MRVLLIDDIPVLRSTIASAIRQEFSPIDDFISIGYTEVKSLHVKFKFDVIIFGYSLVPVEDVKYLDYSINALCHEKSKSLGYDICLNPRKISILLSSIEATFFGYFIITEPIEELSKCLISLKNNKKFLSSSVSEWLLENWNKKQDRSKKSPLTMAEKEVANLLIKGYSNTKIASTRNSKPSTISTIKKNIFRKVGADNLISLKEQMAGI